MRLEYHQMMMLGRSGLAPGWLRVGSGLAPGWLRVAQAPPYGTLTQPRAAARSRTQPRRGGTVGNQCRSVDSESVQHTARCAQSQRSRAAAALQPQRSCTAAAA
eukprot:gene13698-biopygen556